MALFNRLPDEFFRPLAGPSRRLHAALLPHLARKVFSAPGSIPRREDLLAEIGAFLEANGGEREDDPDLDAQGDPDRRSAILRFLAETGWLVEHRDRYVRFVDLDPDARIVLEALAGLEGDGTRSYGGTILEVLSSLETAEAHPETRSESIRSAARAARGFERSLRAVEAAMRKAESRVVTAETPAAAFRAWFEEFVERHLVSDFKTLRTRDNPFRFRMNAARLSIRIAADEELCATLAEGWVREGRAQDIPAAMSAIARDLHDVASVLERIDGHLEAIDDTVSRLEKRIATALRFMERTASGRSARVADALLLVAKSAGDGSFVVDVPAPLTAPFLPLGPSHVAAPPRQRRPVEPTPVAVSSPDPAMQEWMAAKSRFQAMCVVSETRMREFVERSLGGRGRVTAAEIAISGIPDFVLFQRLRELPLLWDGRLGRSYAVEVLPGRVDNGWISCRDFALVRRERRAA